MKNKNEIIPIVFLTCLIVAFFAAYYFLYGYELAAGQRVFNSSQTSEQNAKHEQDIKNLRIFLHDLSPQINKINSYFIASDGEVSFINSIESAAKSNNLSVETNSVNIEQSKDIGGGGLEYLTLKITTKGGWANTYRFISLLSNMPYVLDLNQADMTLVSDNGSKTTPIWQTSFFVRVLKKSGDTAGA